ncbi:MAG: hypothetical protein SPG36_06215 [Eggerthellaceae bacterium]|nr:hypothetical protein [Eggerthellaceae bacterium]
MDGLDDFLKALMAIAAAIVTLGGAQAVIERWRKPGRDAAEKLAEHERRLDEADECMRELMEGQRMSNRGMLQLLNHLIDGNHVDKLKEERDAMERYLVEK